MSSTGSPVALSQHDGMDERPRKRLRKGTHSCLECRRRKVGCVYKPGSSTCDECRIRGTQCRDQAQAAEEGEEVVDKRKNLRERVQELEDSVGWLMGVVNGLLQDAGPNRDEVLRKLNETRGVLSPPTSDNERVAGLFRPETNVSSISNDAGSRRLSSDTMAGRQQPLQPPAAMMNMPNSLLSHGSFPVDDTEAALTPGTRVDNLPLLSLFDNNIITRKESLASINPYEVAAAQAAVSSTQHEAHRKKIEECKAAKVAALRSLVPSARDLSIIVAAGAEWWTTWQKKFPEICAHKGASQSFESFLTNSLNSDNLAVISKGLLCLAVCLQQLGSNFVTVNNLRFTSGDSHKEYLDNLLGAVDGLLHSDNGFAGTIEGLESIVLQAKYYVYEGRPRKSWLLFQRGISYARLLGLHRRTGWMKDGVIDKRRMSIWWSLYQGDRFLSMLLGLPHSISDAQTDFDDTMTGYQTSAWEKDGSRKAGIEVFDPVEPFTRKLCIITGQIIDRNQAVDPAVRMSFSTTMRIDEELDRLATTMLESWWEYTSENSPFLADRHNPQGVRRDSLSPDHSFDLAIVQFWHWECKRQLHLPFLLANAGAAASRYEYSRMQALEASRRMIRCYDIIRTTGGIASSVCRVIDFQTFTASMLLLLDLIGRAANPSGPDYQGMPHPRQSETLETKKDWELVYNSIAHLKSAMTEGPDSATDVAGQSVKVLETLSSARYGCEPEKDKRPQSCRVVIPYFGTITIGQGKLLAARDKRNKSTLSQLATTSLDTADGTSWPAETREQNYNLTYDIQQGRSNRSAGSTPTSSGTSYGPRSTPGTSTANSPPDHKFVSFDSFMAPNTPYIPSLIGEGFTKANGGFNINAQVPQVVGGMPMDGIEIAAGQLDPGAWDANNEADFWKSITLPNPNLDLDQGWSWFLN